MLLETTSTKLSLAVYLIDSYTGRRISGDAEVSLKGLNIKPVRNPSGYYLFLNIPEGVYTLQVTGGEYYFDEEKDEVRLSDLDRKDPVILITLTPTPAYPFSLSATLIRGCVRDNHGRGIPYANVKIKGRNIRTTTAENGEFVIYFEGLKKDDVVTTEGKKLVKIKGNNPVLEFMHSDYKKKTKTVEIEEGRINSVSIAYS